MSDVTALLAAIRAGEHGAADRLMPLVYSELSRLAAANMASEAPGRTLSATALVHEAYLRLIGPNGHLAFESRAHFFAAAAQAMRRILVDAARRRKRLKRGGDAQRVEFLEPASEQDDAQLLALNDALDELASLDPVAAQVVELHHFAGLSHDDTAAALGLTVYAARQKWTFARAWLRDAIS